MDKVFSIMSLFSAMWCNILLYILQGYLKINLLGITVWLSVYIIVLLYNIFTLKYCLKIQKEKQLSKAPYIIAIAGTTIYIFMVVISLLGVWVVYTTGGV